MREIELKLLLDKAQVDAFRRSREVSELADGPPVTRTLTSVYYDTSDHELRAAGIALRLRRENRRWVQTVKKASGPISAGLSTPIEDECPVLGQNLALNRIADDDLREEIIGLAKPGLLPVAQTKFRRTKRTLNLENGAQIELAIDQGEVTAGDMSAPIIEAEFELIKGQPCDLYAVANRVMSVAPVRFSECSKSERALRLLRPASTPILRKAKTVALTANMTAETAARLILTEGLAHALPNIALALESHDVNGPHQTRVALRRLRSALGAFRRVLGEATVADIATTAQWVASEVGRLRDLDVLITEFVAPMAAEAPLDDSLPILNAALKTRREAIRSEVRTALSSDRARAFGLEFGGFLASRGWLDRSDHDQTQRLAQPVERVARRVLNKRWKAVAAYGTRIEALSIEERHDLRKELKKLRYLVDGFRTIYDPEPVAVFTRAVKRLQTAFGALNDAAMTEMVLSAPDMPGQSDPIMQRAIGRVIGHTAAHAEFLWPKALADWQNLEVQARFWR
jgi:inorganic triphosphatase YgiF